MLTLKNKEEKQDDFTTNTKTESELEKWENDQLDIFSDIIISILMKTINKLETNEE